MASVVRISAATVALIMLAGVVVVWPMYAVWGFFGFLGTVAVLKSRLLRRSLLIVLPLLGVYLVAILSLRSSPESLAPQLPEVVDVDIAHGITVTQVNDGTRWERRDDVRIEEADVRLAVRDSKRSERRAIRRRLRRFIRASFAEEGWRRIRTTDGLEFRRASTVEPPRTGSALLSTIEFDARPPELDDAVILHPGAGSRMTLIARQGVIVATEPPTSARQASVDATEVVTISHDGVSRVQAEIVHPALAGMGPLVARLHAGQVAGVAFAASWTLAAAILPTAVMSGFKRLSRVFRSGKPVDHEPEPGAYL